MITQEHNHIFENPFFVGTVIDNNDPDLSYRIKVRLDILHDQITDEHLPWAVKIDSSFMGMNSSSISHSIPEVGSKVLVLAIGNDPNSLAYLGCLYKKTDSTPSGNNYLGSYGIYTQKGEFIGVDKINTTFKMIYEGKLDISKITEAKVSIEGPITINAKGPINVETSSTASLKASTVTVNASQTTVSGGPVTVATGTTIGFNCLASCCFTGATHVSNTSS